MSLKVPLALLEQAQVGEVADEAFVDCIRTSLPYAWSVVTGLAERLSTDGGPYADNTAVPPDDAAWGELFRLASSDAMRAAVERHFGVRVAFQNCCRIALFDPAATQEHREFVSARAQLLNQKPELLTC